MQYASTGGPRGGSSGICFYSIKETKQNASLISAKPTWPAAGFRKSQPGRHATTPCPFSLCLLGFLSLASGHLLQPFTLQMRAETQKKQMRKVKFPGTGTSGSHFACGIQTSQPLVWVPTAHPAQHSPGSCSPGLLLPASPYLHIPQGC